MQPYVILSLQTLLVVFGALALAWWLRRRLPVRWGRAARASRSLTNSAAVR